MTDSDNILINHTIDGVAVDDSKSATPRKRKAQTNDKAPRKYDPYIWGIYILLLIISVIELYSASSSEVSGNNIYGPLIRHCIFLGLGFVEVLFLQRLHYKWFKKYAAPLALLSLGLLYLVSFTSMGANINGAQRSIIIAGITIQPPEIVKLTIMVWLASILAKNQMAGGVTTKGVIYTALVVAAFVIGVIRNGLTNMVIVMGVSICMMLIGNIQWRKLGIVFAVYIVFMGLAWQVNNLNKRSDVFDQAVTENATAVQHTDNEVDRGTTRNNRVKRFLAGVSPDDKITDENRQVMFAKFAQANGGLTGQGPGNSRESARLPLAFSDYIFSIIVEDTGFIGGIALLMLYLFLLGRAGQIARKCSRVFPALLIMGCAVLIVLQAIIHVAIVTGIVPVSGQPLPLISKGGTSILVMSAAIGMMLSVSRFGVTGGNKRAQRSEMKELPPDLQAPNPMGLDNQ